MLTQTDWRATANSLREQIIVWRRDFHRHPELAFQEYRSAAVIANSLRDLDYQVQTEVATTGVVALLQGQQPGPVIMLRFDMDALPVSEENNTEYVSRTPGVMHACGHDAHMAIGLGVATLAARHRAEMSGTLKLVFQPGEEACTGAVRMIEAGVLEDPSPDVVLAAHVWNDNPVGTIAVAPGPMMAASAEWICTIRGRGGHGALPHQAVDPIVIAAQMVTALQTIVSRNVSPLETAVLTVGAIRGGDTFNVIPSEVEMRGTIRTFSQAVRNIVLWRMSELTEGVAAAHGATAGLEVVSETPAVVNDEKVAKVIRAAAEAVVGLQNVFSQQVMVSEDAAFFLQEIPGCYFLIGSSNAERRLMTSHHNPHFDIDEDALPLGVAVMMQALAHYL